VIQTGKTYVNARSGGTIAITEHWDDTGDAHATVERTLPPKTGKGEPHVHLDFAQTWKVLQGVGKVTVDGEDRTLKPGESVDLVAGTAHADPWNEGPEDLVVRGEFAPVPEFIKAYSEAYVHSMQEGKLNDQDEFGLLQIFVMAQATDGQSFSSQAPVGLQRLLAPVGSAIGRLRGYRASYD
jgi:mannose-6-phosphate isomerase-like protein (cupin superfamily)